MHIYMQVYQWRLRQCKNPQERKILKEIDETYMTEENDSPHYCNTNQYGDPLVSKNIYKYFRLEVQLARVIETLDSTHTKL